MKFHPVRPGHCPCCQASCVAPQDGAEWAGCWDGRAESDTKAITCGGSIFAINCVACGIVLQCYALGRWEPSLAQTQLWYSDGDKVLVAGDRWRGRPQAWRPEQIDSHVARLDSLLDSETSVEEAVLTLHTTTGIGAIHLVAVAANALNISRHEAKKIVIKSLSPFADERSG